MILRFPRKGYREKIWDHCAGALIVQEAGGTISDAAGMHAPCIRARFWSLSSSRRLAFAQAVAALMLSDC